MSILEHLVRVFAPHTCLGCGLEEDRLICEECVESMPTIPSRCYKCKAVTEDYAVCKACTATTPLRRVMAYTYHKDIAKDLVHRMKYERARQAAWEIAELLTQQGHDLPSDVTFVHIPTATTRVRSRGYDHALLLAAALSTHTALPRSTLLARIGQAHQVGARRAERLRQLGQAFRPVREEHIRGQHVVLVDDVLTTGATLESAARTLRRAGARQVDALVFAQA